LSNNCRVAETGTFKKVMQRHEYAKLYMKINSHIYPQLRVNPHCGPNIKNLKGEFQNIYRYRISDYRLFYTIDEKNKIIFILDFHHRKDAYT
jgi:mRNA interferase RelE/StbE